MSKRMHTNEPNGMAFEQKQAEKTKSMVEKGGTGVRTDG